MGPLNCNRILPQSKPNLGFPFRDLILLDGEEAIRHVFASIQLGPSMST